MNLSFLYNLQDDDLSGLGDDDEDDENEDDEDDEDGIAKKPRTLNVSIL